MEVMRMGNVAMGWRDQMILKNAIERNEEEAAAAHDALSPRFGVGDVVRAEDGSPLFGIVSKVEFGKATVQTSQGVVERSVSKWEKVLSIAEYVAAKEGA
jgi:hypothetical protein